MNKKTLTVITATYNRAYCLHQVFESLMRQTSDDFIWLIIDDGSTDNTKELVDGWKNNNKFEILYYYKDNGGMHTARNLAYEKVDTELNVIIDSDDWMTDDAVEKIVSFWDNYGDNKYSGIISNNVSKEGKMIGSALPHIKSCTLTDLFGKYKVSGDKKLIFRSELTKLYPYPEFPGEKFYPPSYKFRLLDLNYEMLIMDEYTCVVDYNDNSMTFDKFAQYQSCSKSFAHYRNEMIRISKSPKFIIKEMIHYIAESKMANNKHFIKNSAKPLVAIMCYPFGCFLYYYLTKTKKKHL
ncbi:MAG: glycosyltransferase family 2 protein [Eubacterium sp.]|nr:glycosyltransferase family 2 protein [Eubacterium sp.]